MLTERERRLLNQLVGPVTPSTRQSYRQAVAVEASSFVAACLLEHGNAPNLGDVEAELRARC